MYTYIHTLSATWPKRAIPMQRARKKMPRRGRTPTITSFTKTIISLLLSLLLLLLRMINIIAIIIIIILMLDACLLQHKFAHLLSRAMLLARTTRS